MSEPMNAYRIVITPLHEDDGGGFLATVPELPGCMSDGATQEEALENARLAIVDWIAECRRLGRPVPAPKGGALEDMISVAAR